MLAALGDRGTAASQRGRHGNYAVLYKYTAEGAKNIATA
jgi:hypothetical protein